MIKEKKMSLNNEELKTIAQNIRKGIIECVYNASSGHPGGALSIADVFTVLFILPI